MKRSGSMESITAATASNLQRTSSASWMEWTQQLHAYIAWINSQLKKRPSVPFVIDLRQDLQDGVVLVNLVEILSGEKLCHVSSNPTSPASMRENAERVLQFMHAKHIQMHHITANDVADGNLKSLMRMILALASHYKPDSVKKADGDTAPVQPGSSAASIAVGAAAAIANARREAASVGGLKSSRMFEKKVSTLTIGVNNKEIPYTTNSSNLNRTSGSDGPARQSSSSESAPQPLRERIIDGGNSSDSAGKIRYQLKSSVMGRTITEQSPTSRSNTPNRYNPFVACNSRENVATPISYMDKLSPAVHIHTRSVVHTPVHRPPPSLPPATMIEDKSPTQEEDNSVLRFVQKKHSEIEDDLGSTKKLLNHLQELLSYQPPDGESDPEVAVSENIGGNSHPQKQPGEHVCTTCNDLKNNLSSLEELNKRLENDKACLENNLKDQKTSYDKLKSDFLQLELSQRDLMSKNNNMAMTIEEENKKISELTHNVAVKERVLDQKRSQVHELNRQLQDIHKLKLEQQLDQRNKEISSLQNKIEELEATRRNSESLSNISEDYGPSIEAIHNLRKITQYQDKSYLDTVEQTLYSLIERLKYGRQESQSSHSSTNISHNAMYLGGRPTENGTTTKHLKIGKPSSLMTRCRNRTEAGSSGNLINSTKLLYFTNNSITPFMVNINKRLGEITLGDMKEIHDKQGYFRYHFKALDPEFGTVKEELFYDEDSVPGWEGKIVAWIEEDT